MRPCWNPSYWYGSTVNPAWTSNDMPTKVWNKITYPFQDFNDATVEVWKWIRNFIPHLIMDVITYPCWDWRQSILVKGPQNALKQFLWYWTWAMNNCLFSHKNYVNFHRFLLCFSTFLNAPKYDDTIFICLIFMSQIVIYSFFHSTLVLSFYIDVVHQLHSPSQCPEMIDIYIYYIYIYMYIYIFIYKPYFVSGTQLGRRLNCNRNGRSLYSCIRYEYFMLLPLNLTTSDPRSI